uniref:Uncharacterized protein n=1 Tax=Anopheles coluzzii TaxID=1518534 RepID=A0A8W7PD06_ANOCL
MLTSRSRIRTRFVKPSYAFYRLAASTPPTTSPGPPTTESYSDLWSNRNLNDSAGGLPHHHGGQHSNSYSGHVVDKIRKDFCKYESAETSHEFLRQ